jgi:L-fuconolactonase
MRTLAGYPNLSCKLSGMVTEADHRNWKPEDFTPYIRHTLGLFGPDRVLFGSDWPVCLLAAEYDEVVDVLLRALPEEWGERERASLFGLNARNVYRI